MAKSRVGRIAVLVMVGILLPAVMGWAGEGAGFGTPSVVRQQGSVNANMSSTGAAGFAVHNNNGTNDTYNLTCEYDNVYVTGCTVPPPTQVAISAGQQEMVLVSFTTTGSEGTGWVRLRATDAYPPFGTDTDQVSVVVTADADPPSVTPVNDTVTFSAPVEDQSATFYVANSGSQTGTYSLTCTGTPGEVACVPPTPSSVSVGGGQTSSVVVYYDANDSGSLQLQATGYGNSDTGQLTIEVLTPPSTPSISSSGPTSWEPGQVQQVTFSIQNTGDQDGTYQILNCTTSDTEDECTGLDQQSFIIPGRGSVNKTANIEGIGIGTNKYATMTVDVLTGSNPNGSGGHVYNVNNLVDPNVTPDGNGFTTDINSSGSLTFFVGNPNQTSQTFTLSCSSTGPVTCGSHTSSLTVSGGGSLSIPVGYSTGGSAGTGELRLTATAQLDPTASDDGYYSFTVNSTPPPVSVDVTPDQGEHSVLQGELQDTLTFTISHTAASQTSYNIGLVQAGDRLSNVSFPTTVSVPAGGSADFDVTFDADSVGVDTISVTVTGGGQSDGGSTEVTVIEPVDGGFISITTPGDQMGRSRCVTIPISENAVFQCEGLTVVHAFPEYITQGVNRAPSLVYTSLFSSEYGVVGFNVSLPDTAAPIVGNLKKTLALDTIADTTIFTPTGITPGADPQRLSFVLDDELEDWETGAYPYTVGVTKYDGSQVCPGCEVSEDGHLILVNRKDSPYGKGWWPNVLDRLHTGQGEDDRILLVTGGGSTRLYTKDDSVDVWYAPRGGYPDTIHAGSPPISGVTGAAYWRRDESSTWHVYDGYGRIRWLVDKTGGPNKVEFVYTGVDDAPVSYIRVAPWDSDLRYTFAYTGCPSSCTLDSVTSPDVRVMDVTIGATGLASIQDPGYNGTEKVQFYYSSTGRMTQRHRRGPGHSVFLHQNSAQLPYMYQAWVYTESGVRSIHSFTAAAYHDYLARTQPRQLQFIKTFHNGPRTDVDDKTWIVTDRYGQPTEVEDALGNTTFIEYEALHPLRVSRIERPNGQVVAMTYNGAALPQAITDVTTLNTSGQPARTEIEYLDANWPLQPTRVTDAEGGWTTYAYDASTGLTTSVANKAGHATTFSHVLDNSAAHGLVRTVTAPGEALSDSLAYDATRGNVSDRWTPGGRHIALLTDGVGRVTRVTRPVSGGGSVEQVDSTAYDAKGRVQKQIKTGDPVSYTLNGVSRTVPSKTLTVTYSYDSDDNLLSVNRMSDEEGDTLMGGVGLISHTRNYTYDWVGRRLTESGNGSYWRYAYDEAGNVISKGTQTFTVDTMTYDARNRLKERIIVNARVMYGSDYEAGCAPNEYTTGGACQGSMVFPIYGANPGLYLRLPADTARFEYDEVGNVVLADNTDARVRRTYSPGGHLLVDSLYIRDYNEYAYSSLVTPSDDSKYQAFKYESTYTYDGLGRRLTATYPDPAIAGSRTVTYTYNNNDGTLQSVTNPLSDTHQFLFNPRGLLEQITYAGGVIDAYTYNVEAQLATRDKAKGTTVINDDTYAYNDLGRLVSAQSRVSTPNEQTLESRYSSMGHLVGALSRKDLQSPLVLEEFAPDTHGSVRWKRRYVGTPGNDPDSESESSYDPTGARLMETSGIFPPGDLTSEDESYVTYSQYGDTEWTERYVWDQTGLTMRDIKFHGYDYHGKLRVLQRHLWQSGTEAGSYNEYYYDALGRRVAHRQRQSDLCSSACVEAMTRYVWDGSQVAVEIRTPNPTITDMAAAIATNPTQYGTITYTHALGIDRPLDFIRSDKGGQPGVFEVVQPHAGIRGLYRDATDGSGVLHCTGGPCADIANWPGRTKRSYLDSDPSFGYVPTWYGGLVYEMEDLSGLMYRRNRYYDPGTGQFTQEDPIGLAGGMNLYGFANGDPINFSDPFGLSPCGKYPEDGTHEEQLEWAECKGEEYAAADAENAAEEERLVQRRECFAARAQMGARIVVDGVLVSLWTSALPVMAEGSALMAQGTLVNSATTASLGVRWSQLAMGRSQLATGIGLVAGNRGAGVSVLPTNAARYWPVLDQKCGG